MKFLSADIPALCEHLLITNTQQQQGHIIVQHVGIALSSDLCVYHIDNELYCLQVYVWLGTGKEKGCTFFSHTFSGWDFAISVILKP